ncbi:MAG TPA: hypothetical protein VFO70_10940 [Chitinophagaceae bacterium]|nr:hypothetical protein [Chitinophagaceae bacterium]
MKKVFIASFITLALFACGPSTSITSTWKAENIQIQEFRKVVVLGLIHEADRTLREKMETHLVNDLKALGYDAVCSCEEFNPKAFENMNEEQALAKLRNAGAEAALTIVLLDKTRERYYVPGRITYSPYAIYHNRFWGYYRTMYDRIYTPGYYMVETNFFWETNFYDLKTNQLLYSSQSQSFDPGTSESLGHEYGKLIVKDLVAKKILTQKAPLAF